MVKKSIGPGLLKGMQEALAHSKDELSLKTTFRTRKKRPPLKRAKASKLGNIKN